jgi:hypothetical protein
MITICVVVVKLWFDTFDAYVTTKNSEEGYGVLLQQVSTFQAKITDIIAARGSDLFEDSIS